jgi:hypothetical protein
MTKTLIAFAAATVVAVAVLAPSKADAGRKRGHAVVVDVPVPVVPSGFIYPGGGWWGPPVYSYSPIHTDPLCVWRHQWHCNPWFCQERKQRVCY